MTQKTGLTNLKKVELGRVPPLGLLDLIHRTYHHFGPEVIMKTPPQYEFFNIHQSDRLDVTGFWDHLGEEDISDHHSNAYLKKLKQYSQEENGL